MYVLHFCKISVYGYIYGEDSLSIGEIIDSKTAYKVENANKNYGDNQIYKNKDNYDKYLVQVKNYIITTGTFKEKRIEDVMETSLSDQAFRALNFDT